MKIREYCGGKNENTFLYYVPKFTGIPDSANDFQTEGVARNVYYDVYESTLQSPTFLNWPMSNTGFEE